MIEGYVYTIWRKEGTQKPRNVYTTMSKYGADDKWKELTRNTSLGFKFRMEKNKLNSSKHGKIIKKFH